MVEDKIKKELLAAWDALDEIAGDVDAEYTAAIDTALSRLEAENKILIHARDIATEEHITHIKMEQDLTTAKADVVLIIKKRTDDYHASLKDAPGVWGCGKSVYAAIGNLINAHPEKFNIKIEHHFEART